MKWLSKLFKGGSDRGSNINGSQPQIFRGGKFGVACSNLTIDYLQDDHARLNREKRELDTAVALSPAEDVKKRQGHPWQGVNDEDLARKLHNNLNPPYPSYPPTEYYPRVYRVCAGCNHVIGSGNYLGCMGTFFHPDCFHCRACNYPITEFEFSLSRENAYHKSCFKELTHPKCEVCHNFIPTNNAGLIEYRCHPFC